MKRMRGFRIFKDLGTPLVHVVGDHLKTGLESVNQHSRVEPDHLWITMDPGLSLRVTISVNTLSLRNQDAGFDPRVRVGIVQGTWEHLPERGIEVCHRFSYEELAARDKLNLDIFWLKDDGHLDPDSLPPPEEVAAEIVEKLEAALERFRKVSAELATS